MRASRPSPPPGWSAKPMWSATAGPPTPSPVGLGRLPYGWLDIRTGRMSSTGDWDAVACPREGQKCWQAAGHSRLQQESGGADSALSLQVTSTERDRPRHPQPGAGDWVGAGGLAQERSCPQAAGQRVPGGRRRRSRGARRVREVWAAVRPQLPPGPAHGPIAATRRRRSSPTQPPLGRGGGLTLPSPSRHSQRARRSQVISLDAGAEPVGIRA